MREFVGRSVLVTGAGRGIGKRIAMSFAAQGAYVGLLARSPDEVSAAQLEIEHAHGKARALAADVRDGDQIRAAAECLPQPVSILVAAAAVQGPIGPFAASDTTRWQETFDVNVIGVMNSIHAVLPSMLDRRAGKIIVVTGGGAAGPRPNFGPYAASKAAIVRLVECIAAEVDESNVQINSFAPGGSYTSMTDEILAAGDLAGAAEIAEAQQVRKSGGIPADRQIAAVLFLASKRSNHINGKMIHVNDDLRRLETESLKPDSYVLRRLKT